MSSTNRTTPYRREHGTRACYVSGVDVASDPCRCDACRAANNAYAKSQQQRVVSDLVPAGPIRTHLLELGEAGVGKRTIAATSGKSLSQIAKIRTGKSKRVRRATAAALLAVSPADAVGSSLVDATATWARIDEMVAAGLSKRAIARQVVSPTAHSLQLRRDRITAAKAHAIKVFYEQWKADQAPSMSAAERDAARRESLALTEELYGKFTETVEERNEQNSWRRDAACRGLPPDIFFPVQGAGSAEALKVCHSCTARTQCLDANLAKREGVYGGTTVRQRRALRVDALKELAKRIELEGDGIQFEHGTRSRYKKGCRCDPCIDASTRYNREHRFGKVA